MGKKKLISITLLLFILYYGIELKSMSSNAQQTNSDLWKPLYGKVVTIDGRGLPGVKITLKKPTVVGSTITETDEEGNFSFFRLRPGSYNVEATLKGYKMKMIMILGKVRFETEGFRFQHLSTKKQASQHILNITMCNEAGGIDETGGIDEAGGIEEEGGIYGGGGGGGGGDIITQIHKTTIFTDSGLNQIVSLLVQNNEKIHYSFYFSNGKIYAKSGIAETGSIKKKLNNITEIPKASEYKYNGIKVKKDYVYTIRIAINDYYRIIILRVLNIYEKKIIIEYYIVPR